MHNDNTLHDDIRVFKGNPNAPIVETTNTVILFPGLERQTLPGKASLAADVSVFLHGFLKSQGINTHWATRAGKVEQSVFTTEQLPFDLVVRNGAAGDFSSEFGLDTDHRFIEPLLEFFVRPDSLDKKPTRVSDAHLLAFELVAPEDLDLITDMAMRINDLLTGVFFGIGVEMVDIRMEFGAHFIEDEEEPLILLTSELSPDTMTLQDIRTGQALDYRLAFDDDADGLMGYKEIVRRLQLDSPAAVLSRQSDD